MLGRGDELPCCTEVSIKESPPLGSEGEEGEERVLVEGAATIEASGILFTEGGGGAEVTGVSCGRESEPERQRSLEGRSLVGVFASEE